MKTFWVKFKVSKVTRTRWTIIRLLIWVSDFISWRAFYSCRTPRLARRQVWYRILGFICISQSIRHRIWHLNWDAMFSKLFRRIMFYRPICYLSWPSTGQPFVSTVVPAFISTMVPISAAYMTVFGRLAISPESSLPLSKTIMISVLP